MQEEYLVALTADIASAHVANNNVAVGDLGNLIRSVHRALSALNEPPAVPEAERKKARVSARSSIKPDYLVCLECAARQTTLKRHLAVAQGLTPDQYRADYDLPATYPMAAPNYSEQRRAIAKSLGLGGRTGRPKAEAAKPGGSSQGPSSALRKGGSSE